MAMRPINHPTCAPMQRQYQATCCNAAPVPAPAPVPAASCGGNPYCRICRNDDYPGNPNTMVSARYVGTYSCHSLYHRGKNGQIPGFMCGPLQDRIYNTCGCGQNPPTNRPTPPPVPRPTPLPTRRPTPHPTPRSTPMPTKTPTPRPTSRPTPQPTRRPTPEPSRHPTLRPTPNPTPEPTDEPSAQPSVAPTDRPTRGPSPSPSASPTDAPTTRFGRKNGADTEKEDFRLDRRQYRNAGERGLRLDGVMSFLTRRTKHSDLGCHYRLSCHEIKIESCRRRSFDACIANPGLLVTIQNKK